LIERFGSTEIDDSILSRVERITKIPVHPFLKRGLFFSHRDLDILLDAYEAGKKFYLYTGIGPSSERLHLGHLIPFLFTKYLQCAFGALVVVQVFILLSSLTFLDYYRRKVFKEPCPFSW
jgi:tryptophanyl-tRNA synthetase